MKIMERIKHVRKVVKKDYNGGGKLGSRMQKLGVDALLNGRGSTEWSKYMCIFADNKEQLARLNGKDSKADVGYVKESSAYLVASSPCGGMTPVHFHYLMSKSIDNELPYEPDGTIKRPLPIPEPSEVKKATKRARRGAKKRT